MPSFPESDGESPESKVRYPLSGTQQQHTNFRKYDQDMIYYKKQKNQNSHFAFYCIEMQVI